MASTQGAQNILVSVVELAIGFAVIPMVAGFIVLAQADANVIALGMGITVILPLALLAFAFGLIWAGFKGITGK